MGNVDFGTRLKELRKSENETQQNSAEGGAGRLRLPPPQFNRNHHLYHRTDSDVHVFGLHHLESHERAGRPGLCGSAEFQGYGGGRAGLGRSPE